MAAVINEGSMNDILRYIEIGKKEGRLISRRRARHGRWRRLLYSADGDCRHRTEVYAGAGRDLRPRAGRDPLRNFDHALEIANDTEFGLTGAVYSGSREKLDRAVREFHVGNLYLNRKCTGAMVGAHPFGGFNMSGTDSKSGGPDYLYLFTQAKSVAEKV